MIDGVPEHVEGCISVLLKCPNLIRVDLANCRQLTGSFQDFKALGALLELSIFNCNKIDCMNALELLPTMPWAATIQKLNLAGTNAEGSIQVLEHFPQMTNVNLEGCGELTGDIAVLAKLRHLTSVNMSGGMADTKITGSIQVLEHCPQLTNVHFSWCTELTGSIQVLEHCPQLTNVNFYRCKELTGDIAVLANLKQLSCVNMSRRGLNVMKITGSIQVLEHCPQVTNVDFYDCTKLTGSIQVLEHCPQVTNVDFYGCPKLTGSIQVLEHCPQVTNLDFSNCNFTGSFQDFKALGALLELSVFNCNKINCKYALELLPTMPWAATIQKLNLAGTNAEGHCFSVLFPLAKLEEFDSQNTGIIGAAYEEQLRSLAKAAAGTSTDAAAHEARVFFSAYGAWRADEEAATKCSKVVPPLDAMEEERGWFRALFRALIDGPAPLDKEWLLLLSVDCSLLAAAQVLLSEEFGAQGKAPVESDAQKRIVAQQSSPNAKLQAIVGSIGAYMGRYRIAPGPPVHKSKTCELAFAQDMALNQMVALKIMKHCHQFQAEIKARHNDGNSLSPRHVITLLGWHCPLGDSISAEARQALLREEPTEPNEDGEATYVLVMPQGDRSLHDICSKERIAGIDADAVVDTMKQVAECLHYLHSMGVVHMDIKQRNIIRLPDGGRFILCDMDAATLWGSSGGGKSSTAYCTPELARQKFVSAAIRAEAGGRSDDRSGELASVTSGQDVWSFGVVLLELCIGRSLFRQDTANDELVSEADRVILCAFLRCPDELLGEVFAASGAFSRSGDSERLERIRTCARDLIKTCLVGDPEKRPTFQQIHAHPLFASLDYERLAGSAMMTAPDNFLFFISHAQGDAAGTAKAEYNMLKQLGVLCWYDMEQAELTLEGMKRGVRESKCFLLILTKSVLTRWFCQQEILEAIRYGKKIVLLLEHESAAPDGRFFPFDIDAWVRGDAEVRSLVPANEWTMRAPPMRGCDTEEEHAAICGAVDAAIAAGQVVTHRRRDIEAQFMNHRLCLLADLPLPLSFITGSSPSTAAVAAEVIEVKVLVVFEPTTGAAMKSKLSSAFAAASALAGGSVRVTLVDSPEDEPDKVLILLSKGVVAAGSKSLASFQRAVVGASSQTAGQQRQSRIVCVFLPFGEGRWVFGGDEMRAAPPAVVSALQDYEAIAFRDTTFSAGGIAVPSTHEFDAMLQNLLSSLSCNVAASVESLGGASAASSSVESLVASSVAPHQVWGAGGSGDSSSLASSAAGAACLSLCDELEAAHLALSRKDGELAAKDGELAAKDGELTAMREALAAKGGELAAKDGELAAMRAALAAFDAEKVLSGVKCNL